MKNWKRMLAVLFSVVMLVSMCSTLASCGDEASEAGKQNEDNVTVDQGGNNSADTNASTNVEVDPNDAALAGNGTYVVSVKTAGGMPMAGLNVYVYADSSKKDLLASKQLDENGKAVIQLEQGGNYAVEVTGAPKGYKVESSYSFKDNVATIVLTSAVITGEDITTAQLKLGDVMYDFSVTTPDGKKYTLSEVLKEKKVVLLNFWYTTCGPCASEVPYMEEAYKQYKDKGEIIAVNNHPTDNNTSIQNFKDQYQLSFPMAQAPAAWSNTFSIQGYPTTFVIDRYGVICLVEVGGITSKRPFISMFEHFTADDYKQQIFNEMGELVKDVKPTVPNEKEADLEKTLVASGSAIKLKNAEGEDAEFAWPFVVTDKDGKKAVKSTNKDMDGSYAILLAEVTLKKGQALGMDYIVSSEAASDILHVIVDDEPIYQIAGNDEKASWKTCYPWVAVKDGTYKVVISYIKDESNSIGEDTAYLSNLRVVDSVKVDAATYIPRYAAAEKEDGTYDYIKVVYSDADGFYHVGDKKGPLLLANMMGTTSFNMEKSLWDLTYPGDYKKDGKSYYDRLLTYFSMASNSSLNGFSPVTKELATELQALAKLVGFEPDNKNEWLKLCKYYEAYGTAGKQLEDPCKGLMPFNALKATLGKNVATNVFTYNRVVMPRGYLAEFIPTKSGVYRITSHAESQQGVDAWIFDKNRTELLTYEMDERLYNDDKNVSMVFYMKAGTPYYIDIAYWDVYEEGTIPYDIEYIGASYDHFRLCSPGYFTYDSDATGDQMYYLIQGGIDVVLKNGKYYEDLGNGKTGSLIYADFSGVTSLFSNPIATVPAYNEDGTLKKNDKGEQEYIKGMIDMGGFDFSKSEDDLYILAILDKYDGDQAKAIEYLKEQWGEGYEETAKNYKLDEVLAGKYHGGGKDLTEEIKKYVAKMETAPAELKGCVVVDKRLAEILQMLMEKYTFENVDDAWLKVCYYYDHLG